MKSCIVLQGPLYSHCMDNLCKMVAAIPNCIVSTWSTEDPVFIKALQEAGALHIIQSEKPANPGAQNLNYMTASTTAGIDKAEALGFTHVLRFRTDFALSDINNFMGICESMDPDKLIFMCWWRHHQYLIDYFTYGPIKLMRKYYAARRAVGDTEFNHESCNEKFLQETFIGKSPVAFEDTLSTCDFIIKKAIDAGVELYNIKLSLNTNDNFKAFFDHASYSAQ
jgi:hypothetical protein